MANTVSDENSDISISIRSGSLASSMQRNPPTRTFKIKVTTIHFAGAGAFSSKKYTYIF